jgi:hypothetical protein
MSAETAEVEGITSRGMGTEPPEPLMAGSGSGHGQLPT